ncbi:interleukin-15 receptor subunit alpha [Echinops telfairi]|uniref:Interleukin-15 receptor subunit alpha n=1 Tax=Echinops telfairi TaxID=9371 RepID=A0AC55CMV1_ECHTE|nr:interleukin-15 receptor subunit alpha [Echinops telfairi]
MFLSGQPCLGPASTPPSGPAASARVVGARRASRAREWSGRPAGPEPPAPVAQRDGDITCSTPTSVEHADIRVKSYNLSSRERYTCNSGFKRKAGTSSLTECVLNKTTNTAHWTTPNLRCIRDPRSLARQIPVSPSTVAPARVTPQPESLTPSRKDPEASAPTSDTILTKETAIVTGSGLMPSGTTDIVRNEPSPSPSQTAAKTLEQTLSAFHMTPDASLVNSTAVTGDARTVTVAVTIFVILLLGGVFLLIYWKRTRQHLPTRNTEMEDIPMTGGH